ncbi:MAG: hypothetical protein IJW22_03630, partial [Clostridia bacterium]|nr:hypothetical protein [Clostridia bacterium]
MKTRQYAKVLCATLILALLCAVTLGVAGLPTSAAADITPVAATQITPENLASYAAAGLGEEHIGFFAIESVGNLYWYANEVMGGNNEISAVLTCDLTVNERVLEADGSLVA